MPTELFDYLSAGGDAATLIIVWWLLRTDRRLSRLEFKIFGFDMGSPDKR